MLRLAQIRSFGFGPLCWLKPDWHRRFSRAGSILFWKAQSVVRDAETAASPPPAVLSYVAVGGLLALLVAHTIFAGQMHSYATKMAAQLFSPQPYIATRAGNARQVKHVAGGTLI